MLFDLHIFFNHIFQFFSLLNFFFFVFNQFLLEFSLNDILINSIFFNLFSLLLFFTKLIELLIFVFDHLLILFFHHLFELCFSIVVPLFTVHVHLLLRFTRDFNLWFEYFLLFFLFLMIFLFNLNLKIVHPFIPSKFVYSLIWFPFLNLIFEFFI